MKQIRQRLTYANVMSSIAVFLVLGGATAIAATKIGANEIKANSIKTGKIVKEAITAGKIKTGAVTTTKIADKSITGAKLDLTALGTVPNATNAVNAQNAVNATNAVNANHAKTADLATTAAPRAYAHVLNANSGVGVTEAQSKGITDATVTSPATSVYCFELGFTPTNVQATVDWIGGGANTFAQANLGKYSACPAGSDASVRTTDDAGSSIDNINFYVSFVG